MAGEGVPRIKAKPPQRRGAAPNNKAVASSLRPAAELGVGSPEGGRGGKGRTPCGGGGLAVGPVGGTLPPAFSPLRARPLLPCSVRRCRGGFLSHLPPPPARLLLLLLLRPRLDWQRPSRRPLEQQPGRRLIGPTGPINRGRPVPLDDDGLIATRWPFARPPGPPPSPTRRVLPHQHTHTLSLPLAKG